MAGELKTGALSQSARHSDSIFRSKQLGFKTAGLAALAASDGLTPRKYIKILHHVVTTLQKHQQKLSAEAWKAVKDLESIVKEAAHTHSAAATGKLHYFLLEDVQVQQLQTAASAVHSHVSSAAKLSSYAAPDFQSDVVDIANKLANSKCTLPSNQLQLIEEFRGLTAAMDPSAEISDGVQKAAEQVVRKVVMEVHGPFFNEEILDKELTHLEKVATHLNPIAQRSEAACVKLLASTLMQLDGDEPADDDYDSLTPGTGADPFSMPSFAPVLMSVVDTGAMSPGMKQALTIHVAGDDGSAASSPSGHSGLHGHSQHFMSEIAPASPSIAAAAPAAAGASMTTTLGSTSRQFAAAVPNAAEITTGTTMTSIGGPGATAAAAAVAAAIAAAAAAAVASPGAADTASVITMNSLGGPGAAAAAAYGDRVAGPAFGASSSGCYTEEDQQGETVSAAASHKLLDAFIDSSTGLSTRDSRRACMFHAQMRLPPEGLEKLALFLESSGRVRGLSLAHNWIGAEGMQRLCQAMRVNRSVRTLDLPDNKLGDAGAVVLAQLLLEGSKLTALQLSQNEIGDEGIIALAQAISKNTFLEKLSVYNNNIGSRGCQALTAAVAANPNLKVVEFLPGNCAHTRDVKGACTRGKAEQKVQVAYVWQAVRALRAPA